MATVFKTQQQAQHQSKRCLNCGWFSFPQASHCQRCGSVFVRTKKAQLLPILLICFLVFGLGSQILTAPTKEERAREAARSVAFKRDDEEMMAARQKLQDEDMKRWDADFAAFNRNPKAYWVDRNLDFHRR